MEKTLTMPTDFYQTAEEINFTILINNAYRELPNRQFYQGVPRFDPALAVRIKASPADLHLKFDFQANHTEVYVPVRYRSEASNHQYYFPAFERHTETDEISDIDSSRFLELVIEEARRLYKDVNAANIHERLGTSVKNLAYYLRYFTTTNNQVNAASLSFIEAEQKLVAGHVFHPLTKSRQGFSQEDIEKYSPENNSQFQLRYFLIHPDCVLEESLEKKKFTQVYKEELLKYLPGTNAPAYNQIMEHPEWKVVPTHPWEGEYLLQRDDVREMMEADLLIDLGPAGPQYTPTSSVRTVYNEHSDWMLKFSLHVKLTSAVRVNYLTELYRGYDFCQLLQTPLGKSFYNDHPDVRFISDPGFIAVMYKGKNIEGFNTSIRENPFKNENARKNVGLLASICQGEVLGQKARVAQIIEQAAKARDKSVRETSAEWFRKYTRLALSSSVTMFEKYGFICESHQQNLLVEFDDDYFPNRLFLRDNQSYLFRKDHRENLCRLVPALSSKQKETFIPDRFLYILLSHHLIVCNIMSLIAAFGEAGLIEERALIEITYEEAMKCHTASPNGFTSYVLENRYWATRAHLLTAIRDIDGGAAPEAVMNSDYPNVLHKRFFSDQLIYPEGVEAVYTRYFPKEDATIRLRPIDVDKDLEMLHEWFHRPHAIKIWKMNWPIRQLEVYYRTMIAGDAAHSYIGEVNGKPGFNVEIYWAIRDMVADYYEALPTDYGTHQFIASTDPREKYASPSTRSMVDYVFAEPLVGKMVGEGSADSMASIMNKIHVGFRIEKVIEMPHKKANLNFCYREWYWEKFPDSEHIQVSPSAENTLTV